ncbi:MAG: methylmalonyl-CoA epimerase [Myxococcales bacterium]|nr:methylmalonyl-CoA epimerase [Myxococcales bacterium]
MENISHVAIAVRDLEAQIAIYRDVLGLELVSLEQVDDQGVKAAMFQCGQVRIELLEPLGDDTPVGRFIEKRGEGIHHIAYRVQDLEGTLGELSERGLRLIDTAPRPGAHGAQIAFVHPKSTGGVLTEFCQEEPPPSA